MNDFIASRDGQEKPLASGSVPLKPCVRSGLKVAMSRANQPGILKNLGPAPLLKKL